MAFNLKVLVPTEKQEHLALIQWAMTQPLIRDVLIHIPNEGKRNPVEGYILRMMGLKRGVSDLLLPIPTKSHHGLWIELKRRERARETKEQQAWIDRMRSLGYAAYFCYGCDAAIKTIKDYLLDT